MGEAACIVPAGEGRTIFALPWYGRTLIGTTDNDFDGDIDHPAPGDRRHRVPARRGQRVLRHLARRESDLVGAYAGVRPLISTGDPKKSVDISRKAELYETSSGMLTITGGKLTTWRRMAKQTVDRLVEREGREAPCHTAEIPLGMEARRRGPRGARGGGGGGVSPARLPLRPRRPRTCSTSPASDPKLAAPIVAGRPDLLAEAAIAARHEQARSVADVLLRRTRLGLLAAPQLRDADSVRPVAEAMGAELGWDESRIAAEAEAWPRMAAEEGIDPAKGAGTGAG